MKITKGRVAVAIITLLLSSGSYALGRSGFDVGRAIVESRCSSGAFLTHANTPSAVQADAHSDSSVTLPVVDGQTTANYPAIPLAPTNIIPNGDLETPTPGPAPKDWDNNIYGNNNGRFTTVAGHDSHTALRIDVTRYVDGTADWFTTVLPVTPGAYYQFQDYYRSNVTTRPVLILKDAAGKSQYINLDSVPAAGTWALDTQRFFVPANISQIMISRPLDRAGWLETDNYRLQQATAPAYDQATVSLTFDDGWRSIYDNALPLMSRYDVVSTQYLVSGFLGGLKEYMTPRQVYKFKELGHEIASHTVDHPDLTKVGDKELARQLQVAHAGLTKCFGDTTDFAPPFGASDARTIAAEKPVYQTSRSTEVGFNTPDTINPYQLKVQNVRATTTPEQMRAWLATAKANHVWLILVYHQVATTQGEYTRTPADFEADLINIKASGIPIKTIHDAYTSLHVQSAK